MPSFASEQDKRFAGLIESIRDSVQQELDSMEPGTESALDSRLGPEIAHLCGWVRATMPTLDVQPLEDLYRQFVRRHNGDDPTDADAISLGEEAMMVLATVDAAIIARSEATPGDEAAAKMPKEQISLDARAVAVLSDHKHFTKLAQVAKVLGVTHQALSRKKCPLFRRAFDTLTTTEAPPRGFVDDDGSVESSSDGKAKPSHRTRSNRLPE